MNTAEAKSRELERKLGATSVEELCLRQALSVAHAESERLNSVAEDMHRKYQVAASKEGLLKLGLVDHRRQITFLTQEVEKLKLSHKDTVDRLQLELLQANGVGSNASQTRVQVSNDQAIVVVDEDTRVLHQEPGTPFVSGCDTAVRTQCVLPITSPVSHLTQTSFTTHSVQHTQYTLSVHHVSLC
jgi:hypothetical protein